MNEFALKILENKPILKEHLDFIEDITRGELRKKLLNEKNNINVLSWIAEIEAGRFLVEIFGEGAIEYEPKIKGKRPDWLITSNNQKIIIEVLLFNQPNEGLNSKIDNFLNEKSIKSTKTSYCESYDETFRKHVSKIQGKGARYYNLVMENGFVFIPYIDTIGLDDTMITENDLIDYLNFNDLVFCRDVGNQVTSIAAGIFAKAKFRVTDLGIVFSENSLATRPLNKENKLLISNKLGYLSDNP